MTMIKIYKKLSNEQVKRGIIFTSTLSASKTEQEDDLTHEVKSNQNNCMTTIERLKNDSFFNNSP